MEHGCDQSPLIPFTMEFCSSLRPLPNPSWRALTRLRRGCGLMLICVASWLQGAEPIVGVAKVARATLGREITVQGEFRPYQEVDLHAKVAGYLQTMKVDIGDAVKPGDLIAVLEVPELRGDLARGEAATKRAEANFKETHASYTRLLNVSHTQANLVSQQDIDTAEAKDAASAAALTEAKSDLEKLRTMEGYTRIFAPFEGVVTKRYADAGALIQAGISSSTQAMPLVRLSQNNRLRLSFPVTTNFAAAVAPGSPVTITLGESRRLTGSVARVSRRISSDTRTMQAEVDVPNSDLTLIPGMYAAVTLRVDQRESVLSIPVEAVAGAKHPTVYAVDANQQIEERAVKIGMETATRYEILEGLKEGDLVVIGNRSLIRVGQKVNTKIVEAIAAQ